MNAEDELRRRIIRLEEIERLATDLLNACMKDSWCDAYKDDESIGSGEKGDMATTFGMMRNLHNVLYPNDQIPEGGSEFDE